MAPRISVLIPVYGVEKYIRKCLISLFSNTIASDCEFIIVNDCTKDNSMKIIEDIIIDYSFLKIKVINHETNLGLAGARNTGLKNASGKYIICCDSDDWVEKNYLEELYNEAEKVNADITGCDLIREYVNESRVQEVDLVRTDLCASILTGDTPGWLWIKLFKKSLFTENDIMWVEGLDMCEDTLISLKAFFYAKKVAYINKALYHYNLQNQNSLTSKLNEKKVNQIIENNVEYEKFLEKNGVKQKYSNELLKRKAFTKIWILLDCDELKKEYFRLYSEEKLHKVKEQSFLSKFFLFLLKYRFDLLARIFIWGKKK